MDSKTILSRRMQPTREGPKSLPQPVEQMFSSVPHFRCLPRSLNTNTQFCNSPRMLVLRQARRLVALRYFSNNLSSHAYTAHNKPSEDDDSERELPQHLLETMERRISSIQQRHSTLLNFSTSHDPTTSGGNSSTWIQTNRELSQLSPSMQLIQLLRTKQDEIRQLKSMANDPQEDKDLRGMANEELTDAVKEENRLLNSLFRSLLPKDEADHRDCIIEVRAGSGGEEASLFAMDVFRMYERYSHKNGWKFDVIQVMESELKGFKEASGAISGTGAYGKLKFESGIHRVQRVPVTEKAGRVHTSAVSVAILPQADEVDVQVRNEDLRIDTYRAGGCGGQSVNTTNSAVRVTHIPSGIVIAIQDERSQHMNKAKALKLLRSRLYEIERARLQMDRSKLRSEQIGSGDRSERIRTYNFPQGRVTDHRVGVTQHSIEDVLAGESLDIFIDALLLREEMDAIASFASEKN